MEKKEEEEKKKENPESKDHDPWARSVTLLNKELSGTLNALFVLLKCSLVSFFDCVIINTLLVSRTKSCFSLVSFTSSEHIRFLFT